MKELWELCRKLNNPERLGLLMKVYRLKDSGITVNDAVEGGGLGQSGTSQYLKQLNELGILRRERGGRLVAYYPDTSSAPHEIAEIAEMMYVRFQRANCDISFTRVLGTMGNAARARMVGYIARGGDGSKLALAEKYDKEVRFITRDLEPAVRCGLLELDSEDQLGTYTYRKPDDPIARRIVELSA